MRYDGSLYWGSGQCVTLKYRSCCSRIAWGARYCCPKWATKISYRKLIYPLSSQKLYILCIKSIQLTASNWQRMELKHLFSDAKSTKQFSVLHLSFFVRSADCIVACSGRKAFETLSNGRWELLFRTNIDGFQYRTVIWLDTWKVRVLIPILI